MARSTDIPKLSTGSLKRMLDDDCVDSSILQLMDFWRKDVPDTPQYELLLNDGETLTPAKLNVLLNNLIEEKHLEKFTIFELKKYTCTENRHGIKVITCHEIELLSPRSTIENLISPDEPGTSSNFDAVPNDRHKCNDQANKGVDVFPIVNLKPCLNKWTIMARVVYKSPIKTSKSGNSKYLFLSLLDQTAEIRAVAFENQVDLHGLHDKLEINEVYFISGANVQRAYENCNLLKIPFELGINTYTTFERADNSENIPNMPDEINFQPITTIKTLQEGRYVSVIGVCYSVSDLKTRRKWDGSEVDLRELKLIDKDKVPITLTLWSADAHEFNGQNNPVIVARNAKVCFYNNPYLSFVRESMLFVNPEIPEATQLLKWFDNLGDSRTGPNLP